MEKEYGDRLKNFGRRGFSALAVQFNRRLVMAKKRKKKYKNDKMLHVIKPNAAGIDIGASEIYIAVPGDRDNKPVRHFDTFTADLHAAAKWLKSCVIVHRPQF